MVVKTKQCIFCEKKCYPGYGKEIVRLDSKKIFVCRVKDQKMVERRVKATKIRWTVPCRRLLRKETTMKNNRKRRAKKKTVNRSFEGMELTDLIKKQEESKDYRKVAREENIRAVKERNKKKQELKKREKKEN